MLIQLEIHANDFGNRLAHREIYYLFEFEHRFYSNRYHFSSWLAIIFAFDSNARLSVSDEWNWSIRSIRKYFLCHFLRRFCLLWPFFFFLFPSFRFVCFSDIHIRRTASMPLHTPRNAPNYYYKQLFFRDAVLDVKTTYSYHIILSSYSWSSACIYIMAWAITIIVIIIWEKCLGLCVLYKFSVNAYIWSH